MMQSTDVGQDRCKKQAERKGAWRGCALFFIFLLLLIIFLVYSFLRISHQGVNSSNPEFAPCFEDDNQPLGTPIAVKTVMLPGKTPLEMVWIPEGTFTMKKPQQPSYPGAVSTSNPGSKTYSVTISQGFWMATYELTRRQWAAVLGLTYDSEDIDYPVGDVSWNEVQAFISTLNEISGKRFRLPTSAEWEYAYRAGTTTRFYWGDDVNKDVCYVQDDLGISDLRKLLYPVGRRWPNPWGLYDMAGNAAEWCQDGYYTVEDLAPPAIDPVGLTTSLFRAVRSAADRPWSGSEASFVTKLLPNSTKPWLGFRLVLPGSSPVIAEENVPQ